MNPIEILVVALVFAFPAGAPCGAPGAVGPDATGRPPGCVTVGPSIAGQVAAAARQQSRASSQSGGDAGKPEKLGGAGPPEPAGLTPLSLQDPAGQVTSGTAFNPAMSVIPDLAYYNDSRDGQGVSLTGQADGFHSGQAEEGGHSHGGGLAPGFNLREIEVALSGAVDPYFDAWASIAIGGGEVEVEEAYVRTRRLPSGVQVKAGRFLSDIGYINRQHPHQWAFANQNLAHDLVLGGGLGETGVQLTWLPSLPVYVLVGFEALQGENEAISAYQGPGEDHSQFSEAAGPRLFTGFAKFSPDLGFNHALQVGGSFARARRHQEEEDDGAFFEGRTVLIGLDAVYKYDSPKPHGEGDAVVQGEYLRRSKSLAAAGVVDPALAGATAGAVQDGVYVQGSYGFAPRWTAAFRVDAAGMTNRFDRGGSPVAEFEASRRVSTAFTFDPTDFSRLRFQVDRASMSVGGVRESFTQVYVQLQVSLGVHGAHKF